MGDKVLRLGSTLFAAGSEFMRMIQVLLVSFTVALVMFVDSPVAAKGGKPIPLPSAVSLDDLLLGASEMAGTVETFRFVPDALKKGIAIGILRKNTLSRNLTEFSEMSVSFFPFSPECIDRC